MQFKMYTDVHEFYHAVFAVLLRHEAQNMIPLGNVIIGHAGEDKTAWRDTANWLMATVSDASGIRLTALMTPPHNITLYATDNQIDAQAIACLLDGLSGHEIPGVMSEKTLAEQFAEAYAARNNICVNAFMGQRIYELTRVNPTVKQFGTLRLLEEKDMPFFPYWAEAFNAATVYGATEMAIPQDEALYHYRLASKRQYVLEDNGVPVCMAGFTRELPTSIGVAFVYTPPYYRGRGYASSCVALLSQIALNKGFTRCVLYTDLANPTSNSIYQKIGYTPVCDSVMLEFEGM